MGLTIQRRNSTKTRAIITLVALFALVTQPMYGLVAGQVANAASDMVPSGRMVNGQTRVGDTVFLSTDGAATLNLNYKLNIAGEITGQARADLDAQTPGTGGNDKRGYGEVFIKAPTDVGVMKYIFSGTRSFDSANWTNQGDLKVENGASGIQMYHNIAIRDTVLSPWKPYQSHSYSFSIKWLDADNLIVKEEALTVNVNDKSFAPSAPVITTPAARSWHKAAPIKTAWTKVDGATEYQVAYKYDNAHSFANSTCVSEEISGELVYCRNTPTNERNHSLGLDEQGGVTVWVRAVDGAGKVGAWSKPIHYYYDHEAPVTTLSVENLKNKTVGSTFKVSGVAEDNFSLNRVYVQLVNRQDNKRYGVTTIHLSGVNESWNRTYSVADNLPEGTYAAHVSVVDNSGNASSTGWTDNFTLDKTGPNIIVDMNPAEGNAVNGGDVTITGTVDSDDFSWYRYQLLDENKSPIADSILGGDQPVSNDVIGAINIDSLPSGSLKGQPLPDGQYFIRVWAQDLYGNQTGTKNVPNIATFTVDRVAPNVTFDGYVGTSATPVLTGSSDAKEVEIAINGSVPVVVNVVDDIWSYTPTVGLIAGQYDIIVTAHDAAGNIGTTTTKDLSGADVFATFTITALLSKPAVNPFVPLVTRKPSVIPVADNVASLLGNGFNMVGASSFVADPAEVLGAQDVKGIDTGILGASKDVAAITPSAQGWKFFGYAWYWWLLTIAAVAAIWWWIAAARRRSQEA